MTKIFCPFINGKCRDDCVFCRLSYDDSVSGEKSRCGLATGLANINDRQSEELQLILKALKSRKD